MALQFDPTALRAVLKAQDDHWVVDLELATGGSWGHAETTWTSTPITRQEVGQVIGDEAMGDAQAVVGFIEVSLRRAGWRTERSGNQVTPPTIEVWDLSPAAEYYTKG